MVWTAASTPAMYVTPTPPPPVVPVVAPVVVQPATFREKFTAQLRGVYRVFNSAVYRFYRDNSAAPDEGDTPYDTNATLPHEPTDTFADGTWRLALAYFNGVLSSGFGRIGPRGETFRRLDLASAAVTDTPPPGPDSVELQLRAGGVVRVVATMRDETSLRGDTWSIAYTTNGTTPPTDTPDVTVAIDETTGLAYLQYDLPAQSHGTTVKVRVQLRRDSTVYSEDSTVLTATADAQGPAAPGSGTTWPGALGEA